MEKEYLVRQKPMKAIFLFSLPMIVGNLFQQFYTMADSVIVGRFVSQDALAAVGASYSLTNVFISIAIGGGVGASVITSRYFGSRNYAAMKRSIHTALVSFLILGAVLGTLGFLFGKSIMHILQTPDGILNMAAEYLNIYFLGLPFLFLYNVLSSIFNSLGRSRIPLYLLIFSSLLNIFLDLAFISIFRMGVAGVAWATLIAQGFSAVLALLLFLRELSAYKSDRQPLFDRRELKNMSKIAFPSILQQSTVSIGMMLVQSVVNSFGAEMLAGFSAAMRIESICVVPMSAMGNAMSTYTSQNIGAGLPSRVQDGYRGVLKLILGFSVLICLVLECFHMPIISVFLGVDGTLLAMETGSHYLRFMGWFFVLIGLKMSTDGLLRGAGDMKMFTAANLVNLAIRVLMAVSLAPRFGIQMVWYAVPVGWLANFLISFYQYRTGKWKHITI